jgi:hypothetical protein
VPQDEMRLGHLLVRVESLVGAFEVNHVLFVPFQDRIEFGLICSKSMRRRNIFVFKMKREMRILNKKIIK